MVARILPLLSKLIPQGIAMKGLSKINPRIGSFLTDAAAAGYPINEALEFLRDQAEPSNKQGLRPDEAAHAKKAQQSNLIPEAIGTAAKAGLGAGAISALPEVIGNLFQGQQRQPSPEENPIGSKEEALKRFREHQQKTGMREDLMQQVQGQYSQQMQGQTQQPMQSQQQGNSDQALLAALQKILQM